jgi:hypothetical protein
VKKFCDENESCNSSKMAFTEEMNITELDDSDREENGAIESIEDIC